MDLKSSNEHEKFNLEAQMCVNSCDDLVKLKRAGWNSLQSLNGQTILEKVENYRRA